jgi:N-carbamoyl-L-amino-acid hydrolase
MRRFAETGATPHRLPSGPLHDAAEVARACVPTIMMFVQGLHGINHNKMEDTKEEHLELAIIAFDKLVEKTMQWIGGAERESALQKRGSRLSCRTRCRSLC